MKAEMTLSQWRCPGTGVEALFRSEPDARAAALFPPPSFFFLLLQSTSIAPAASSRTCSTTSVSASLSASSRRLRQRCESERKHSRATPHARERRHTQHTRGPHVYDDSYEAVPKARQIASRSQFSCPQAVRTPPSSLVDIDRKARQTRIPTTTTTTFSPRLLLQLCMPPIHTRTLLQRLAPQVSCQ